MFLSSSKKSPCIWADIRLENQATENRIKETGRWYRPSALNTLDRLTNEMANAGPPSISSSTGRNTAGKTGFLHDDAKLHKLCHEGKLKKVRTFVDKLEENELAEKLSNRKGVFGYTPLHEAVASGKSDVLDFVLNKTNNAHVNCRANSGYTPLHLAASSGHGECVRTLLRHGADISITDEYGKTPKQTAELSSKGSIVRLLRSEGETIVS